MTEQGRHSAESPAIGRILRLPLLLLAMLALLAALWAGLLRLPWSLPPLRPGLPVAHGPVMIGGFLGTLIGLERAVGLQALGGRTWTYAGPLVTGLGSLALILELGGALGPALLTLGSVILVATTISIYRVHPALHSAAIVGGSLAWLAGNLFWLFGRSVPEVVLWWAGFLVLTIVGERLELSRMLGPSRTARQMFALIVALFVVGLVLSAVAYAIGTRLVGLALIGLALWLLRYDIARRTIHKHGVTRFVAVALLLGFVWLAVAGLLGLAFGGVTAGLRYDAFLHTLLIGFVLSMIFGHAPIMFPALLGVAIPFRKAMYGPLVLLHLSLLARVAGDLLAWLPGRRWGGLVNEVALVAFFIILVAQLRSGGISPRV